ncbi:MAG: hypothetical protein ACRCV3_03350 [Desulfovibrionaceae bacterium]
MAFDSAKYWNDRYREGGTSGAGSYNRLAEFKAEIINDVIKKNSINSVIEFGSGDGNNLSMYVIPHYLGVDVSETIIGVVKEEFKDDKTKKFIVAKDFEKNNNEKADMTMSLDVIYHLIEENVFTKYMEDLFSYADRYVILYASNKDEYRCEHVVHRKFTDWIEKHASHWQLMEYIPNRYPWDENDINNTSFSDFYIYKNCAVL